MEDVYQVAESIQACVGTHPGSYYLARSDLQTAWYWRTTHRVSPHPRFDDLEEKIEKSNATQNPDCFASLLARICLCLRH
jgi:hypothetical protein